jgi:methionyl-tRNA formyltransferase
MKVIFFGTPSFAAPSLAALLASRHSVAAVVTQPDRARGRGQHVTFSPVKALALEHQVPVLQPAKLDAAAINEIRAIGADIAVVAAYGKILPQSLLDYPLNGFINVHASLLPRWRGAAPIHRAILAGDTVTGVTIMRVVFALDAGPMLSRIEVPIFETDNSVDIEGVLATKGAQLLIATLSSIECGTEGDEPQDESLVTYAKKIERADGVVDWSRSARDIHNQIRGLHPWPLASALLRGKRVIIRRSWYQNTMSPSGVPPGTVIGLDEESITVATGAGVLDLRELQAESRNPVWARAFASGLKLELGERFEPISS